MTANTTKCKNGVHEFSDRLSNCFLDLSIDIPDPHPLISQGDITIVSPGNISVIAGKAKSKKTFFSCAIVTAFYSGECLGLKGKPESNRTVLLIDTEQGKAHCLKVAKRIHRMCGFNTDLNNPELLFLSLREYIPKERTMLMIEAIKTCLPSLVIIDGIRDLVIDINSQEEATATATMLMQLSTETNAHIICVIHENKGDTNLRGHLGTELMNKAETVFSVKISGKSSIVSPAATRNYPFDNFTFIINDESIPVPSLANPTLNKEDLKKHEMHILFNSILSYGKEMNYTALVSEVMVYKKVKIDAAKKVVGFASNQNIIIKVDNVYKMV